MVFLTYIYDGEWDYDKFFFILIVLFIMIITSLCSVLFSLMKGKK